MTVKRNLRDLIDATGSTAFAAATGFSATYINKVKRGDVPGSLGLLRIAKAIYGAELDLEATIGALSPDGDECGQVVVEGVDHVQP